MDCKLRWIAVLLVGAWWSCATVWLSQSDALGKISTPLMSMNRCVADTSWDRLCHDAEWQDNGIAGCDLCLLGIVKPRSQEQHERECSQPAIREDCAQKIATTTTARRIGAYFQFLLILNVYLSAPLPALVLSSACCSVWSLASRIGSDTQP